MTLDEPARTVEVIAELDVLVVGGGPAGVCAAVAAARAGARTMIVERHGFVGGMWTAGMVLTLAGYNCWLRPYPRCVFGIPGEWLARGAALGGAEDSESWVLNSDPETLKLVGDQLLEEAGVLCLYHTWAADPIVADGRISGALVENVDGRRAILSSVTVDATGNGDVAERAGASWKKGPKLQPMTMAFSVTGARPDPTIDHAAPVRIPIGPEPTFLQDPLASQYASRRRDVQYDVAKMRRAQQSGRLPVYGGPWFGGLEKDTVWVNTTRLYGDASNAADLTRAEMRGRRDVDSIFRYYRDEFPGFENAHLAQTGPQIGVRETLRIMGEKTLLGQDIRAGGREAQGYQSP